MISYNNLFSPLVPVMPDGIIYMGGRKLFRHASLKSFSGLKNPSENRSAQLVHIFIGGSTEQCIRP